MAIIRCSECGNEVSDRATNCPHCGAPLISENSQNQCCPKCGSIHIQFQREQTGSVGAGTNKVVVVNKRSKGCLYWLFLGWWIEPMYWIFIGWWWRLLFGGRKKGGLNFNASKTLNKTIAICQDCGNSWTIK